MVGMYLARETTEYTLEEIGEVFNRHHTAVIHGHKTIEALLGVYPELRKSIDYLMGDKNELPPAFMPYANC